MDFIPHIDTALKELQEWEVQIEMRKRTTVAKAAKRLGLRINHTQCKRYAKIFYSCGFLSCFIVFPGDTLEDFLKKYYFHQKQPYRLI